MTILRVKENQRVLSCKKSGTEIFFAKKIPQFVPAGHQGK